MERFEEFTCDGKSFMYIDFSGLKADEDFIAATEKIEPIVAKYPKHSLYTITNIANTRFDTRSKEIVAEYMEKNKPHVKYGAVIGIDGIKKIMLNTIFQMSGRKNLVFAFTKEKAIELLLKHEQ